MSISHQTETNAQAVSRMLTGKVALITGSGRGLGKAIAELLASAGADVCVHDINEDAPAEYGEARSLTAVAAEMTAWDVRTAAVTGNIADEDEVHRLVRKAEAALGPISVLVNCAGGDIGANGAKPSPNDALGVSMADVRAILDRNLIGTMMLCRAVCPGMIGRNEGSVINVGSINGHQGTSPEVAYACAKAAIIHYTRCLALELRTAGVRVNAVSPGPTTTARFLATREADPAMMDDGPSLQRYGTPREVADAVAFLASDASRFISGQVLRIDGGLSLYPG